MKGKMVSFPAGADSLQFAFGPDNAFEKEPALPNEPFPTLVIIP